MAIDKRINFEVQGGVKNYLGKQKEVKAPIKWKSSPDSPETELAYITKAEKDLLVKKDLHGSLKGGVNRGPSGIMSLDGFGSADESQNVSGTAASAAETGSSNDRDRAQVRAEMSGPGPALPPGVTPRTAQDFRSAAIAAGAGQRVNPGFFDSRNTVSPFELAQARAYNPSAFKDVRGSGIMNFITSGGLLGNLVRGMGQKFGLGKKYNEPTYDMSGINTRVYENIPGASTNPDYYNDLDNELIEEIGAIRPVQKSEDNLMTNSDVAPEFQNMIMRASGTIGNYAQNAVSNQLYGKDYVVLDPFEQQQIDTVIETYGTKSTGELASGTEDI